MSLIKYSFLRPSVPHIPPNFCVRGTQRRALFYYWREKMKIIHILKMGFNPQYIYPYFKQKNI